MDGVGLPAGWRCTLSLVGSLLSAPFLPVLGLVFFSFPFERLEVRPFPVGNNFSSTVPHASRVFPTASPSLGFSALEVVRSFLPG